MKDEKLLAIRQCRQLLAAIADADQKKIVRIDDLTDEGMRRMSDAIWATIASTTDPKAREQWERELGFTPEQMDQALWRWRRQRQ